VVSDGNTFGESEAERLTVRHLTSTRFAGLPVFHASSRSAGGAPGSKNLDRFPTDLQAASFVGLPPHDGGVLQSYINVVYGILDQYSRSQEGLRAEAGDEEATRLIASELDNLQTAMRNALATGQLFAFWPVATNAP
jgi:hypothetical protein